MNKLLFFTFMFPYCCFSQSKNNIINPPQIDVHKNELSEILKKNSQTIKNSPTEKLYIQFDKSYYALGDTVWFKAYLLNNFLLPSAKSGVLNIDIANDSNKVVKQYRFSVQSGLSWGDITLNNTNFNPGNYVLRAYTNWMRNFGDDGFFYKTFTISGTDNGQLLVSADFGNTTINANPSVEAKLRFSWMTDLPFAVQPVTLQLMNGNNRLYMQKYLTGVDGGLDVNFRPPQNTGHLTFIAENDKKERLAVIPVPLNRPQNADVEFLPEGGSLVAGLPAHIGFKIIGEDGKGMDAQGIILDHTQKQVGAFKSLHSGMGSFDIDVNNGENYTAQVTLPGGVIKQYALPLAKSSGTILFIKNEMQTDSLAVVASASNDIAASSESFFLIGRARGIVCYAAIVNFHESNSVSKRIAKSLFPTGIAHFTLMTTSYQPVNERLVFIDQGDDLKIRFITDKTIYNKRDSVGIKLKVTDGDGNPISGNFSLGVADDAQIRIDTLGEDNIKARLILTTDLKGYIEQPGYYFSSKTIETFKALDNLLLTQGWVGYDWAQVLHPPLITFQPQLDFVVTGHVTNVLSIPLTGAHVVLFSKFPAIIMDTITDKNGQFVFDHLPRVDTPAFVLKAVNKSGKSFNVNVKVDEISAPAFLKIVGLQATRWYINPDSIQINYTETATLIHQQQNFPPGSRILKEVKITAKKGIKNSQNLNGPGNADIVLDEKDLEKEGKKTWLQILEQNVKGFKESQLPHSNNLWYFVNGNPILIIVDGIKLNEIVQINPFIYFKLYLESHTAEDIKGIEIMSSSKYNIKYKSTFLSIQEQLSLNPTIYDITFIEITTRSGHGPIIDNTPGMYLFKPMSFSYPQKFYKPKYIVKDTTSRQDLRSTIDWEPNVTTNANGEANIWFYTADKPSTYTVTIEGTDMNGHFGYAQGKIKVEAGKNKTK